MDFEPFLEVFGEGGFAAVGGLLVGAAYGAAAQRSRFCLRAASVEFARGEIGSRTSVWLLCFGAALFWTQALVVFDLLDLTEARWRAIPGSVSGALIGGLIFGAGMVLARGCPGRLLVLASTGNLRALLGGLVFAVAAQTSLHGALSPIRGSLAALWTTPGPNPSPLEAAGLGDEVGLALGALAAGAALYFAFKNRVSARTLVFGSGVGVAAAAGWFFTGQMAGQTFDPMEIESLTFSGPSADVLTFVLAQPFDATFFDALDFDIGLIPGVALGAAIAALLTGEWSWEGYDGAAPMRRSLLGAAMMGFGAMLAGGCAIGAGVTGTSAMALTAWVALTAFWAGAMATDYLVDRPRASSSTDQAALATEPR